MSGAGLLPAPARASRVRGSRSQPFANAQSQQTAVLLVFACAPKAVGKALAPQPCPNRLRPLRRWTPADPVSGLWEPTAATPFVGSSAHYVGSLRDKAPPDSVAVMHTLPLQVAPARQNTDSRSPRQWCGTSCNTPMGWAPRRSEGRRPTSC